METLFSLKTNFYLIRSIVSTKSENSHKIDLSVRVILCHSMADSLSKNVIC